MAMPAGRTTEIQTTTPASRVDIPASPAEALNLGAADQTSSNSVPVWQDWRAEARHRRRRKPGSRPLRLLVEPVEDPSWNRAAYSRRLIQ
ncbi:hypothetical protein MJG53_011994 [Ovis ammon polii x Ovis aries]|uniref:Uncharacterized protein n=1 Tax=Ovis ammon polii x Ovis aries TaxID=2918886 RepID=A0ACB9UPZ0_9CETA|nr:hypothetical protein MJG53_011994 [Ovis ammon polii x Ovis aries]